MSGGSAFATGAFSMMQMLAGISAQNKANDAALTLERNKPIRKISQYDRKALNVSESEMANPISAQAEQAYDAAEDRSLSSSIAAILKSGADVNNIGDMYGNTLQGRQNLAIMRDNMRMKNVDKYLAQLDNMAQQEDTNWLVNEYGPYINKLKAVGEAKRQAAANTSKAMDSFMGASIGGMSGGQKKDDDGRDQSERNTDAGRDEHDDGYSYNGRREAWGNYNQTHGFDPRGLGFDATQFLT